MPMIVTRNFILKGLLCLLLMTGLTGCSFVPVNLAKDTSRTVNKAVGQSSEPLVTLKFFFGGEKKAATDEVWGVVRDYVNAKGLNVKFSVQFIPWTEYSRKLLVMAAAGDRWDLNFDSEASFQQMASRGSYLSLNKLLPKYAPKLYEHYQQLNILRSVTSNGDILALPWMINMNQRPHLVWRQDLAEKAGIYRSEGSIRTAEDVDLLLHELKQAYPNNRVTRIPALPLFLVRDEWVDIGFHGLGFYLNDPTVKIQAIEDQPFYMDAAKMSKTWYEDRILTPDSKIDNDNSADQWRNGKMLTTLTSHEWAYVADPGFVDVSYRQQASLLYPDKKTVNRSPTSNVVAINRNSEHPELVLKFMEMLETDSQLYDLVIYGIQGKTYELDGGKVIYPDNLNFSISNYMDWGSQWAFWKMKYMRPTNTYPGDFWNEEARFAESSMNVSSPVTGLLLNDQEISSKLEKRDQNYEDYGKTIEYGMVADIEEASLSYRALQEASGRAAIIQEVQSQVDQFLKSQPNK